jgi:DNA repair protein RadC
MAQHIFPFESDLQNNLPEAAPSSPSLCPRVSEKLALCGSTALSGLEHLALLLGNEEIASDLIRHFGSIKVLSRATLQQIRQFLPRRKAETVVAAFSVSMIAESEHARSELVDNPESVYRACADMKLLNHEVLRIVLLDAKRHLVSMVELRKAPLTNLSLILERSFAP